jgi:hypothetical protein
VRYRQVLLEEAIEEALAVPCEVRLIMPGERTCA